MEMNGATGKTIAAFFQQEIAMRFHQLFRCEQSFERLAFVEIEPFLRVIFQFRMLINRRSIPCLFLRDLYFCYCRYRRMPMPKSMLFKATTFLRVIASAT